MRASVVAPSSFAALLRGHRLALGLTQEELAERAGLSARAISDLERGLKQTPRLSTVRLLVRGLGLPEAEAAALLRAAQPPRVTVPDTSPSHDRYALPLPLSSFVGREQVAGEVAALLGTTRLVTVTGVGGVGKTRLALHVAALVQGSYAAGAGFVDLAVVVDPLAVPRTAAAALDVREQPGVPLLESLVEALSPLSLLLVLDNCEHVVQACAELAERLLGACSNLRILATSRERLGLRGEMVCRLTPLTTPASPAVEVEDLIGCEAVQLFVQRTSAVEPGFRLTRDNAAAVAALCRSLDGIPLAIELAAARTNVLSVKQLVARLDDRFRVLSDTGRRAPLRQQTLQATLDWSYSTLSADERRMFHWLVAFTGGCSLRGAEAVRILHQDSEPPVDMADIDVLDQLGLLIDKSLLVPESRADGEMRYRMLETVRQYGRQRLAERGDLEAMLRGHATYCLYLVRRARQGWMGSELVRWLNVVEREHDNLRAALDWAFRAGETDIALELAASLWRFWSYRGHASEAQTWLELLLAGQQPPPSGWAWAEVLFGAGALALQVGSIDVARSRFEQLRDISTQREDQRRLAMALTQLAHIARAQGELDDAQAKYEQARAIREAIGAPYYGLSINLAALGELALDRGDTLTARSFAEEARRLAHDVDDDLLVIGSLSVLARAAELDGTLMEARRLWVESLKLSQKVGHIGRLIWTLDALARLAITEGEVERGLRLHGAAVAHRAAFHLPVKHSQPAQRGVDQQMLRSARRAVGAAAAAAAFAAGQALSMQQAIDEAALGARQVT